MSRTKEALGRKSRQLKAQNQTLVFMTIARKDLSFSELLNETRLSRASLAKHLKQLEKDGIIYKDTIKPDETSNPQEIGKIVYKLMEDNFEWFLKQTVEMSLAVQNLFIDEEVKKELKKHSDAIAKIISNYIETQRAITKRLKKKIWGKAKEAKT